MSGRHRPLLTSILTQDGWLGGTRPRVLKTLAYPKPGWVTSHSQTVVQALGVTGLTL
jgi:hypothetical protein